MFKIVNAGEIYTCDFGNNYGSVQSGVRPCVVIDNMNACAFRHVFIAFHLPHKIKKICHCTMNYFKRIMRVWNQIQLFYVSNTL